MVSLAGVHLLPATGEFTYDTLPYLGQRASAAAQPINTFHVPGSGKTDYSYALDQLQAAHPECRTVSLVCAWFANSLDASQCQVYPSTTYVGGSFQIVGGATDVWRASGLTQSSPGLIELPVSGGAGVYGGTPSDQSVVRCLRDLKARGLRVVFYPFLLMTSPGYPWRGEIGYADDLTAAAASAVASFLGSASTGQFTPDTLNLTVAYSGSATDYTYRRMILHYAWLCVVAGGVDLFLLGSELRGLETIRGPGWSAAGGLDGSGNATWDYPFVAGLEALAADVRAVFDSQGLAKTSATPSNLVGYSADWSNWMGAQHSGANGQWPHLDSLWASPNIDLVGFDNYLPLSDWTTGAGGLDPENWLNPPPSGGWPPGVAAMNGLGLSGPPTIYSAPYIKANIEGGERFSWYYVDGLNIGPALDPNGSDLMVTTPHGDRLSQTRTPYSANQQLLANKQFRWWWHNRHQAIYDNGDGSGWSPHGAYTAWIAQSKSIAFIEYGLPSCDKGTNQPNVFYDAKSTSSMTPFWSIWQPVPGGRLAPQRDDTLSSIGLQSIYDYWNLDGNNENSSAGIPLVQFDFCCAWNWDARPFPTFPALVSQWGDAANWQSGNWINGKGPTLLPPPNSPPPAPGAFANFPTLSATDWSSHVKPRFGARLADHVAGRVVRRPNFAFAKYDIELSFDSLRASAANSDMQDIVGFFEQMSGSSTPFWVSPPGLTESARQTLGLADGRATDFPLVRTWGDYSEPVAGVAGVTGVYLSGALQSAANWSLTPGFRPSIVFLTAPAVGEIVSADFNASWLCRFADDVIDVEEFMTMLFHLRLVKLSGALP